MKRVLLLLLCIMLLTGCDSGQTVLDAGHQLRNDILAAEGCSFVSVITADYGDELYEFSMQCEFDKDGALSFTILTPESVSGITGSIDSNEGALTFDDHVLAFNMLADGQITPVSAPWVMMRTLRGGYISAFSKEKDSYFLQFDDSYNQSPMTVDLWINDSGDILRGEFLWNGRRILSVQVLDFKLM